MGRQVGDNGRGKATIKARDATKGAQILQHVAAGHTVAEAARLVKVSAKHASDLYRGELRSVMESNNGLRQDLIARDLETLRQLLRAHMGPAIGQVVVLDEDQIIQTPDGEEQVTDLIYRVAPDPASAKIVLAVLDRHAKLMGLDAAVKVEISQARINDTVDTIVSMMDGDGGDELAEVLAIEQPRAAG
jgi:hypothetical protein